jgi:hypothetical protein
MIDNHMIQSYDTVPQYATQYKEGGRAIFSRLYKIILVAANVRSN